MRCKHGESAARTSTGQCSSCCATTHLHTKYRASLSARLSSCILVNFRPLHPTAIAFTATTHAPQPVSLYRCHRHRHDHCAGAHACAHKHSHTSLLFTAQRSPLSTARAPTTPKSPLPACAAALLWDRTRCRRPPPRAARSRKAPACGRISAPC